MSHIKLALAPMATISHEAFRKTVDCFGGCDEYFSEMIHAPSLLHNGPFESSYLLNNVAPQKMVWQLTSPNVESFSRATEIVCAKGGIGVDLNMGCSAPQIYKTGAGSAWMTKPLLETAQAVREVKQKLTEYENQTGRHMRLSVKCRLGSANWTEESFFAFTKMLESEGVELITLHARTQKEKYRGLPNYDMVQKLCERLTSADVMINGCIDDLQSSEYARKKVPLAKGIMIARAAVQKPWIFSCLAEPDKIGTRTLDAESLALRFIDDVEKLLPKEFYKTRLQRFFSYYCKNFSFAHYFATQMINSKSIDDARVRIKDYFIRTPEDRMLTY